MGISRTFRCHHRGGRVSLLSMGLLSGPQKCPADDTKPARLPMAADSATCLVGEELGSRWLPKA